MLIPQHTSTKAHTAMLKLPLLLLAGFACAQSLEPAPESGTLAPPPDPTSDVPGKPAREPVSQRWHFLTPSVDYVELQNRDWETSNLAASSPYYSSAMFRLVGTGINIIGGTTGDVEKLDLTVNNTDPEIFGAKGEKKVLENGRVEGKITGLPYGWWVLGLRGSNGTVFHRATAIGQPRVSRGQEKPVNKAKGVKFEGQWENGRTNSTGASVTFCPPLRTGLIEVLADQPPVPFGAFRVTIDPKPSVGPSMQDYFPHLAPADIQAAIAHLNVPIYSTVLEPMRRSCVKIQYIGDGTKPLVVDKVAYHT